MDLSPAHLHLLLNHLPTVGLVLALALLVFGLLLRSDHLTVASLVSLVVIALLAVPVYATGSSAHLQLCGSVAPSAPCGDETIPRALIDRHESLAFVSYVLLIFAGGFAWLALWLRRRLAAVPAWATGVVLALSVIACGTVARAAAIGGEIRHTEIRVIGEAGDPPIGRVIADFINNSVWTWAANETFHLIGLTLLLGVMLVIDLKVLGIVPTLTYAALDRLLPWAILGFGLNALTGMLFFLALPASYADNPAFGWKLVFLVAAGLNTLVFTFDEAWTREGQLPPVGSRILAGSALVLWVGVLYWGSVLPFVVTGF